MVILMSSYIYGQLTIDNLTPTESTCEANGTITVTASGGTDPYIYAITAGPETALNQSVNLFEALPAGTYTVRVADAIGDEVFADIDVPGTYVVPSYTPIAIPEYCEGTDTGKIEVTMSGGVQPFDYTLIAPSPVTQSHPDINSNTFTFENLPPGDYRVQVIDDCGNIQTRDITLPVWADPIASWANRAGLTKICGTPPPPPKI